MLLERFVSTDQ